MQATLAERRSTYFVAAFLIELMRCVGAIDELDVLGDGQSGEWTRTYLAHRRTAQLRYGATSWAGFAAFASEWLLEDPDELLRRHYPSEIRWFNEIRSAEPHQEGIALAAEDLANEWRRMSKADDSCG